MQPTPVDLEAIVSQFLRVQLEITTIVAQRVYTDLPNAPTRVYPLVLVTRAGSAFRDRGWVENVTLRLDCYGDTHGQARNLASTALSVLCARLVGRYPAGAVTATGAVTGVDLGSLSYEPDPDTADEAGHDRPRYVAVTNVYTHP